MRRLAWGLGGLALVVAGVLAAAFWLAATESGFRWLTATAVRLSGGQLVAEGVTGHLARPIGIRKLAVVTDTQRVTLERVRLEWRPRALLARDLEIELFAAERVVVETLRKDPTPPEAPATLRLPVSVHVARWDVARLELVEAGETTRFDALGGTLEDDGERYRLAAAGETPWAGVKGQLDLGKDAPFALAGRLDAAARDPVPVAAKLDLAGRLEAVTFAATADAEGMRLFASGEARPFARVRLARLVVAGEGIDPRRFAAEAPGADLAFSGVFEGLPGERLLGTFSLSNTRPGRFDEERLPVAELTGAVVGDAARADFSDLVIDLGRAGRLAGAGQWRDGRFEIRLASPRLDLAGLHRDLYPTRLQVDFVLAGDAARQVLTADVAERWGRGRLVASLADSVLRIDDAQFSGESGRLAASGSLTLDARRAFAATFDAARINPARFGEFPRGRLNARGEVKGALQPALNLEARFTLPPGDLEGRPVRGEGRLRYGNGHLADADVDVEIAGNRARFKGAYGHAGDRLTWDIDAPALERLRFGIAGRLKSAGVASGEPRQPNIEGSLEAGALKLPGDTAVDRLSLTLKLQAAATGAFDGRLDARGIVAAGQRIDTLRATVAGRRDAHAASLDARLADSRVKAELAGGLGGDAVWRGRLDAAEVEGEWPMRLLAPAALTLGRDVQQVTNLGVAVAGGRVSVAEFRHERGRLATRGSLANLPAAPVLALLESPPPLSTDLRVRGEWDLRLGDALDGRAYLERVRGDVRLKDPAMDLGLTALRVDLAAEASRVTARVAVRTQEAGSLQAEGRATLERVGGALTLPRSAPLAWTARVDVPDLRIVRPLLPIGMRANARLAAALEGGGSLAAPTVDGRVDASRIRFAMPEEGVSITDGTLALVLAGDRVRVEQGVLSGQSGRIKISGEAELKNPRAGLTLDFEEFAATHRSDRRVIVSGRTRLRLDPERLELTGELGVDRARLEMPEASRPELSSDVVVVGREPREKPAAKRIPLALDLTLKLGSDFLFKGAGLDVRLGGQLRVFTVNQALRGEGTIRVVEGRYAAYAQTLDIERGVLRFSGPIDNPGLDVLAVRKTPTVKAGVLVGGTVQSPVVKLYSDPALPDTEKLAWLVLGHGLDDTGQQEFVLLQLAAGALLSQAESVSVQSQMAETLGIDSFDVRAGSGEDLGSTVVSVGKRLSSRATLSYEHSVDGLSQVVKVLYQLTPRIRLEAQAGQQSSFDVFYSREYD